MESDYLSVQDVAYARAERELFSGLSFNLVRGEVLQLLGPNGVGKTSLLRLLTGVLTPSEGKISWAASSINLYFLGHQAGIKFELTVWENLALDLRSQDRSSSVIMSAIQRFDLTDQAFSPARELSQGQRQRVALAKLLLSHASVWLLDEPFASLDRSGIGILQQLFKEKIAAGGSVILTTHQPISTNKFSIRTLELKA